MNQTTTTSGLTGLLIPMLFALAPALTKTGLQPIQSLFDDHACVIIVSQASKYSYKIIDAPDNTFGYDIYADGKLLIHQSSIPGLPGNNGFKTKARAEKVAKLVIKKLNAGEMPPTVTIEELKKQKAI